MRSAVLAGGAARRFDARPKGLQTVGGRRILDAVVDTLTEATGARPLLIANDPEAVAWRSDLDVRADLRPGSASLGGIYTAVLAESSPVFVAAWDMPFLNPGIVRAVIAQASDFDVFAPESRGPRGLEPLSAVYSPTCADAIVRCVEAGQLQTTAFHDAVRVGRLPLREVVQTPRLLLQAGHALHRVVAEARHEIGGDGRIGMADMRLVIDIVDGCSYVERSRHRTHSLWHYSLIGIIELPERIRNQIAAYRAAPKLYRQREMMRVFEARLPVLDRRAHRRDQIA